MANPPPRAGLPKDKDDDSWGKLASDLLGIQFGGMADDDLDLPDDDVVSPPAKSHVSDDLPPTATSGARPVVAGTPPVDEEPDLTFPEEDSADDADWEADEKSEEEAAAEVAPSRDEPERDIWDLLENWDETSREPSRPKASDEPQRPSGRGDRRGERDNRRERSRDRGGDRPSRPRESSATAGDAPREGRTPRREAPPRRPEPTERSTARPDRSRSEQPPPPRSVVARETTSGPTDDFASGLDVDLTSRSRPAADFPAERSQSKPAQSRAASSQPQRSKTADVDDFAGDLFVEPEPAFDESTELESTESGASEVNEEAGADERRPRRRRRRRGGRGRRDETDVRRRDAGEQPASEAESSDDEEEDVIAAADSDESDVESTEERDEASRESRRPRRRRRRGRRRPESTGVRQESESDDESDEDAADENSEEEASTVLRSLAGDSDDDMDEDSFEEESIDESEETVVAISYDDIPSWEEAISYLQRTRPRDSRSRNEGSSRGRGGPNRR